MPTEDTQAKYCPNCGIALHSDQSVFCEECGGSVIDSPPQEIPQTLSKEIKKKSIGIAATLAIVPGFLSIWGIGHLYAGKTLRGIILLVISLALTLIIVAIIAIFGPLIGALSGLALQIVPLFALTGLDLTEVTKGISVVFYVILGYLLIWAAVWVWQVIDACRAVQIWNKNAIRTEKKSQ